MPRISIKNWTLVFYPFFVFFPTIAHAQTASEFLGRINSLIQLAAALLLAVAGIVFIWGVVKYIASGDDPAARKKAMGFILFGIIGIAVILAFWGLVRVTLDSFGLSSPESRSPLSAPQVPALPGARPYFPSNSSPPSRDFGF